MKSNVVLLLAAFCLTLAWSSCSIYEDGPGISFTPKKKRVVNDWKVDVAFDTETEKDVTEDFKDVSYSFLTDGTMARYTYVKALDSTYTQLGLWDLVNNNAEIRLLFTDPPTWPDRDFWKIQRLAKTGLWVLTTEEEVGVDTTTFEIRFMPSAIDTTN